MTAPSPTLGLTLARLLLAPAGSAEDLSPRDQAEALFEEYQRRAAAFDPKVADLYWDHARIVNVSTPAISRTGRSTSSGFSTRPRSTN